MDHKVITVRMSKAQHEELKEAAYKSRISLNKFCLAALRTPATSSLFEKWFGELQLTAVASGMSDSEAESLPPGEFQADWVAGRSPASAWLNRMTGNQPQWERT